MGIVISALTGSENPSEVAVMAKQASEVIFYTICTTTKPLISFEDTWTDNRNLVPLQVVNMVISLVEALQTSFSSS